MQIDPAVILALRVKHYRDECEVLGLGVVLQIREGRLLDADAYWWGRILGHAGRKILLPPPLDVRTWQPLEGPPCV